MNSVINFVAKPVNFYRVISEYKSYAISKLLDINLMSRPTIESDWENYLEKYSIKYPFDADLKAIKIREDDVDDELLKECVENHIISEVSKGYFITHEDIEEHQKIINKHGIEAYLRKRLEVLDDQ